MSNPLKIRLQGDMDGACYLYSLANAYQALTEKSVNEKQWSKLIDQVGNARDFLDVTNGTSRIDDILIKSTLLTDMHLKAIDKKFNFEIDLIDCHNDIQNIGRLNKDTILIAANEEHWYCIVDFNGRNGKAMIACSAVWQIDPSKYKEKISPTLKRYYNDSFFLKDQSFVCLYKVTKI